MLHINENDLKILLLNRKNKIESPKYNGIGEIISSISIMITLCLADFSQISIINPLYFKLGAWILSLIILIFGVFQFIKSIFCIYSINNLYSEIADLDPNIEHPFNIILIKNNQNSGRYLLFKSKRWNCWLFPNYHCSTNCFNQAEEILYIKKCLNRDLNIPENITVKYIGNEIINKLSVPNNIKKKYNFHYFVITNLHLQFNTKKNFRFNGKQYCWKTLDKMYSNKNIVKKNKDVLDYVRKKCEIS